MKNVPPVVLDGDGQVKEKGAGDATLEKGRRASDDEVSNNLQSSGTRSIC